MVAIEWMTTQMDIQGEIRDLESAMQVSLDEAELEKQKQKPLQDLAEQELVQQFKGSLLMPKVAAWPGPDLLLTLLRNAPFPGLCLLHHIPAMDYLLL